MNNLHDALTRSGTCNDDHNAASSRKKAQIVLGSLLPSARKLLDAAGVRLGDMKRGLAFASKNKKVYKALKGSLDQYTHELTSLWDVNENIERAGKMLQGLNCDALATEEIALQQFTAATKLGQKARAALDAALAEFDRDPCKDFAKQGAPMSPGQVGGAAGGGGGRSTSAGKLEIVAPVQIHASRAVLPISLRAHENGFVRIELSRGSKLLTGVSGLISVGAASLRIEIPTPTTGAARLRVIFAGASHKTSVATLAIRLV